MSHGSCMQVSSDLSVVDFDIPFTIAYVLVGAIEVVTTIIIMVTVTWQVLIVAIPVILAASYVQLKSLFYSFYLILNLFFPVEVVIFGDF